MWSPSLPFPGVWLDPRSSRPGMGEGREAGSSCSPPPAQPPPSLHSPLVADLIPPAGSPGASSAAVLVPTSSAHLLPPIAAPASFPSSDRSSPVPFVGQRPLCGLPPLPFSRPAHTPSKGLASCLHCLVSCTVHRPFPLCLQVTPPGVLSYSPHPHSTPFPFGLARSLQQVGAALSSSASEPCEAGLFVLGQQCLRNWPHLPGLPLGSGLGEATFSWFPPLRLTSSCPQQRVQSPPCPLSCFAPPAPGLVRGKDSHIHILSPPHFCLALCTQASAPGTPLRLLAPSFLLFPSKSPSLGGSCCSHCQVREALRPLNTLP